VIVPWIACALAPWLLSSGQQDERDEIQRMRRRGETREALEAADELVAEHPDDAALRALRSAIHLDARAYGEAEADARAALVLGSADSALAREAARALSGVLTLQGRSVEAAQTLEVVRAGSSTLDARDDWALGSASLACGKRARADEMLRAGAERAGPRAWDVLLDQARCQRALGRVREAAETLVAADRLAQQAGGVEPDVLVELGELYLEFYGEVDDALSRAHSPADLYREALRIHPTHEGARLGLFDLYRFNFARTRTTPGAELAAALAARPDSIPALLAQASAALDDGELVGARQALARLRTLAPARREVRTQDAALAWIEHDRERAEELLRALSAEDPADSAPERELGRHLLELYRFEEGRPFLERASARAARDWRAWRELARALANTGQEAAAREAFARAVQAAEGRRDAWRDNTARVLAKMDESFVDHGRGSALAFRWSPAAAAVYEAYFPPFYRAAREELAARYGHTPGPVTIEVFESWADFSVRSTGFEGYPALGVCFGPVVTVLSPLGELRGSFAWTRSAYHEFTHVVHLGLSHNRCPRWVTEGLATWEETRKDRAWDRNMRRELIDARANDDVIPLRALNHAFRGPRVLFAYYQSGLFVRMLVEEHGFAPLVRLLEAFDGGADLDQAFAQVFARTPEEIEARFDGFLERMLDGLRIEPRLSPQRTLRLRLALARTPPPADSTRAAGQASAARVRWAEDWCSVAWGFYWQGQRVDAEEALRCASLAGELPPRGLFLRAELRLALGDEDGARTAYRAGFAAGGEEFRARIALAALCAESGGAQEAEQHLLAAERDFPGYDDPSLCAELALARLYDGRGDEERAMAARLRWLAIDSGSLDVRLEVARWLSEAGRHEESVRLWSQANDIDPFRRAIHLAWGRACWVLGRLDEALREAEVGLRVPIELDGDVPRDPEDPAHSTARARFQEAEAELELLRARALAGLGRRAEARAAAQRACALDPECEPARTLLESLEAPASSGG
jgi:predicted Zn-dependent protease